MAVYMVDAAAAMASDLNARHRWVGRPRRTRMNDTFVTGMEEPRDE
jgi:hypothetical protein